jgi:hypothetical protein
LRHSVGEHMTSRSTPPRPAALASAKDARAGEILTAVIRHAHDLAREVRLTPGELLAAADFLRRCGEISDEARHEYILLSDVLGLTMVVAGSGPMRTAATTCGPPSRSATRFRMTAPWESCWR